MNHHKQWLYSWMTWCRTWYLRKNKHSPATNSIKVPREKESPAANSIKLSFPFLTRQGGCKVSMHVANINPNNFWYWHIIINVFLCTPSIFICWCCIFYALFLTTTESLPVFGGYPYIFTNARRNPVMSGIENKEGGRHCFLNALLQCMSINDIRYTDLQRNNVNHIMPEGK